VILAGNLTRDPQLSYLPSNTPVAEFGLAINRKWKSQNGEMREETCFVDCSCFGKQAETLNQYMSKGRPLLVEGRLQFQQWTAKDGTKRSKLKVIVEQFQFLGGGGGGRAAEGSSERAEQSYNAPAPAAPAPAAPAPAADFQDSGPPAPADSEIPF
jgi:single-strand DNA-binding protein